MSEKSVQTAVLVVRVVELLVLVLVLVLALVLVLLLKQPALSFQTQSSE